MEPQLKASPATKSARPQRKHAPAEKRQESDAKQEDKQTRATSERYKIQIQLSERAKDRLFLLVEKTEAETAAQVVREALRIYDVLVDELDGTSRELFLRDGETQEITRLKVF